MSSWSIYLIRCGDNSLYTGIATDVDRRLDEHRSERGARYLRGRAPLKLVLQKEIGSRSMASKVEYRIKRLSKDRKEYLIEHSDMIDEIMSQVSLQ